MKKANWYDGKIFSILVEPLQKDFINYTINRIEPDKNVLDVGCGTGTIALRLAEKGCHVTGIDYSQKMIDYAKKRQSGYSSLNGTCDFQQGDAGQVSSMEGMKYDYAILSFVIHEVPESGRVQLLNTLKAKAHKILIIDFVVPPPKKFASAINRFFEFIAGKDHYSNFKSFCNAGGLVPLLDRCGLSATEEALFMNDAYKLVIAEQI